MRPLVSKANLGNVKVRLTSRKGLAIFTLSSIISYVSIVIIDSFQLISSYLTDFSMLYELLPGLIANYQGTVHTSTYMLLITTSILIGANMALLLQTLSFEGIAAAPGTILGFAVTGCASCTTGVVSIAGASVGLGFLPYNGLEVNMLGTALLGFSTLYISEKDRQKVCKINSAD